MPYNPKSAENLRLWKAGQTGNPSGRGILEGTIRKALEEPDPKTKRAKIVEIVDKLVQDAVNGDKYASTLLFDRGYGKATQPIETPEGGLVINVISGIPTKDTNADSNS